jgi:hypothetical protein
MEENIGTTTPCLVFFFVLGTLFVNTPYWRLRLRIITINGLINKQLTLAFVVMQRLIFGEKELIFD